MVDLHGYPAGARIIVRRERPHPGARFSQFDLDEGTHYQAFLTDTPYSEGSLRLEVCHHTHAQVEDRIRCDKTTGCGSLSKPQPTDGCRMQTPRMYGCEANECEVEGLTRANRTARRTQPRRTLRKRPCGFGSRTTSI
ncbi:hypothetical protein [Streptomyces chartreusis]